MTAAEQERLEPEAMDVAPALAALQTNKRGMPKSGRWWKDEHKNRHSNIIKVKPLKSTWAVKMKQKNAEKMVKAKQTEIREALAEERTRKQVEKKEREERRKLNEKKAEVVQVIRNTHKLKRAKKKQLRKVEMRDTGNKK